MITLLKEYLIDAKSFYKDVIDIKQVNEKEGDLNAKKQ